MVTGEYRTFKEIWYEEKNGVGYLFFEFHNGAMSTEQCKRPETAVLEARQRTTKVLVFMGGVRDCLPINAGSAAKIGMIDAVIGCNVDAFEAYVAAYAETHAI